MYIALNLLMFSQELSHTLLPDVMDDIFASLRDVSDDVRAAAATALLSIVEEAVETLQGRVAPLLEVLWLTLSDLDDLTSSTSSVMSLIAALVKSQDQDSER